MAYITQDMNKVRQFSLAATAVLSLSLVHVPRLPCGSGRVTRRCPTQTARVMLHSKSHHLPMLDRSQSLHIFPFQRISGCSFPLFRLLPLHQQCCSDHLGSFHAGGNLWRLDISLAWNVTFLMKKNIAFLLD